ncbi:hypothetical protein ACTIVE_3282 [Actinomadura verrucosospora]|uniref:Uncharacterized protein n=1 Tax=Actinomadura verrucosospora TaxID=46165 RepID=A0A7D3ZYW1_ACTVE|nr:hypothetical protein ACTIVE_3282 [Actinomadura verrucosospora]
MPQTHAGPTTNARIRPGSYPTREPSTNHPTNAARTVRCSGSSRGRRTVMPLQHAGEGDSSGSMGFSMRDLRAALIGFVRQLQVGVPAGAPRQLQLNAPSENTKALRLDFDATGVGPGIESGPSARGVFGLLVHGARWCSGGGVALAYGAAPPKSRAPSASLRDGLRPPLTLEPLRPLRQR